MQSKELLPQLFSNSSSKDVKSKTHKFMNENII